jgi:hypothetical protein
MKHKCKYCDYESAYKPNVRRHENIKHGVQEPTSQHIQEPICQQTQLKTSHMQNNSQQNSLVVQNQYLQNKVIELQSLLRNQNIQTNQTFSPRKRFRLDNDNESETLSDVMETDEHPQDFLSELDSEESDTDVAHELEDIITDIDISFTNIVRLRKKYLKALEEYNEIEDEDKKDIFKKYIKLKGKIWMEWYDLEEEDEEEEEENGENEYESEESEEEEEEEENGENEYESEESEEEGEKEGVTRCEQEEEEEDGEEGGEEGEDGEDQSPENDENSEKHHLMNFVLQLESIADEDDKTHIERLWKKRLDLITMTKDAEIDSNDTESENEDDSNETDNENEDDDTSVWLQKNKNRIKKMIEEFDERGNIYFKHCNKEKIETIRTWCNKLLNKESKILKNTEILNRAKEVLMPVGPNVSKLANINYPISKRRKLLQKVQVGKGIMSAMETIVLPYITKLVRNSIKK